MKFLTIYSDGEGEGKKTNQCKIDIVRFIEKIEKEFTESRERKVSTTSARSN